MLYRARATRRTRTSRARTTDEPLPPAAGAGARRRGRGRARAPRGCRCSSSSSAARAHAAEYDDGAAAAERDDDDDDDAPLDLNYVSLRLLPISLNVDRATLESCSPRPLRKPRRACARGRAATRWVRALTRQSLDEPPLARMRPAATLAAAALGGRLYVER